MLKSWNPGVKNWREALDTKAVRQFKHIKTLLDSHPGLERIPDQSLVLAGQGTNVFTRVQAMRDGTPGNKNATYLMAYLSAPGTVTLDTSVIAARTLRAYWFDPENGDVETIEEKFSNIGSFAPEKRTRGDAVIVIEDAMKTFRKP